MTLKDADKIKEAIKNSDDFVGGSDDIIKVIDSVQEVVIDTDTDTISRQQAMEEAKEWIEAVYCDHDEIRERMAIKHVINGIKELPPAQPESDSGRWERHYSRPGVYADLYWHCSKCGYKTDYQYANVNHRYCPNCGRKMEREVSDE